MSELLHKQPEPIIRRLGSFSFACNKFLQPEVIRKTYEEETRTNKRPPMMISYVLLGKIPTKPVLLKRKIPSDSRRILGYFYDSSVDLHLKVAFIDKNHQSMDLSERTFMIVPVGEQCDMGDDAWVFIGSASGTFLFMKIVYPGDAKYWRFIPGL